MNALFRMLKWLLVTVTALLIGASLSQAGVLISGKTAGEISIQSKIFILKDSDKQLAIQSVSTPLADNQFILNKEERASYGYTSAAYWIKVTIAKNPENKENWYLKLRYPHLDQIEFYAPDKDGHFTRIITGDSVAFSHRPVANQNFIFPIFPKETGSTYYLRLSSQGVIKFPLTILDKTTFHQKDHKIQLVAGLYFGALIIMVAYNLLFLFFVRERLYLYYACFVLLVTLHQVIWFGFGFEYLWPDYPGLNNKLDIFAGNGLFFFIGLFVMDFLETKKHIPKMDKVLKLSTAVVGVSAVLIFILDRQLILGPTNNANIIQMVLILTAAVICFFKRNRQAKIFLLAWSMALLGGLSLALAKSNFLPEAMFWSYGVQIGILANVLLISLGLADRINNMKNTLSRTREKIEQKNQELIQSCSRLEASEKRFRDLSDLLPQTVFEMNVEGRMIYANEHGMELTGYSKDDFRDGLDVLTLFNKKYHQKIKQDMSEVFASNATMQGEYELRRKDGFHIPVFYYVSPILSDNQPVGIRGVALDLSERKKTEEIMIQTEKMMSVGGLAAGMAHEINNPLAGMIQSAQVLENRLTKPLPANDKAAEKLGTSMDVIRQFMEERGVIRMIDNINHSGFRASKIIQNMLTFAKKGDSVKRPCELDKMLDDTVALAQNDYNLKKKFDFKDIEIVREYSPDMPPVLCEQSKIQQVVFNLIKNASQAMGTQNPNPGSNENSKITLRLSKQFNWALIEIIDNGPGMNEETRKRIFEPFFTTKGLDKGTGLGLSVSYFIIVDDHGGEMKVDSEPGKGAAFSIRLPMNDVPVSTLNYR